MAFTIIQQTISIIITLNFLIYFQLTSAVKDNNQSYILCAKSASSIAHFSEDGDREEMSPEFSGVSKCLNNYCYTLWQEDPGNGTKRIMAQGCWDTSDPLKECERSECLADKKPPKAMNITKFCCCSEDMCNLNFTDAYVPVDDTPPVTEMVPKKSVLPIVWIVSTALFIILIGVIIIVIYIVWLRKPKKNDIEIGQHPLPPPPDYSLDKLKLLNMIGQGRYGCVWRGVIDEQEVAVKIFAAHHRNYFLNEHEMYKISGENSALLKCYGGGEYNMVPGGPTDYLLILSLEQECLQEYLKNHTIDLTMLSKMSLGIAKGLAHLHTDLGKPCIAHRDINTRNILVRSDLTCCICDLGLAVIPRRAENKSISEAGTLRYMAPEVLEGAVNLRDCESALKQIDVYALGLVLWELGMRCTDMQNTEPQPYAPPFYKEGGENPTSEQMQTLVSRRKARPLWPPSWKDTSAARLLCETAEDCWDQDAEARLTSLCVVERLLELPSLKGRVLHPIHPPASPTPLINNNHLHDHHQIDVSIGTIETLLSPSEEHCKNSNQLASCVTPLQSYQGRNPCMERNLLTGSSDSLLIDKSSKHCTNSESQNLITNDFLNYQINHRAMPIPYLQNAVHSPPKQYNSINETHNNNNSKNNKFKWNSIMKLFHNKKLTNGHYSLCKDTQVKLNSKLVNSSFGQNGVTTTLLSLNENNNNNNNNKQRPSTLPLTIVKNDNMNKLNDDHNLLITRQRSLEQFNEIFSSINDLSRLKDPSQRIKTPGDVPPSVRRTRGKAAKNSARFSLYDDRIMCRGQWGSAPDLEPPLPLKPQQLNDIQDRDSVSSF